jgi:hypothetical protein
LAGASTGLLAQCPNVDVKEKKEMKLEEINALVSQCLEIDPTKQHVLLIDHALVSESATCALMTAWKALTGHGPIVLRTRDGGGVRIFEIEEDKVICQRCTNNSGSEVKVIWHKPPACS